MKRTFFSFASLFIFLVSALFGEDAALNTYTESITYTVDGQKLVGFLAYDKTTTTIRPGILVVHEWRGINDNAKKRAVDLAKEGYVAFALDMYGKGKEIP